jgi:hypothetical protein
MGRSHPIASRGDPLSSRAMARSFAARIRRAPVGRDHPGFRLDQGRLPARPECQSNSAQSHLDAIFRLLSAAGRERLGPRITVVPVGAVGNYPWHVLYHFQRWTLDLARPFQAIEKAADRETRRHLRRAREAGVSVECARGAEAIDCFFALQLESRRRLGVPSQPLKFFRTVHEVFARLDSIEVWFALHQGKRIAGVVVLCDGNELHAKWSARVAGSPDGSSHLIFMAIAEHHAQRASSLDFGRTDSRNRGLSRFKRELGASATDLPYSYFPQMPTVTSAENLTGVWQTASRVWRNLPLPVARVLNNVTYRYLA